MDLKLKLKLHWQLKYLYLITTVALIVSLVGLVVFLYFNFYQTITQSKIIIVLKQEVAYEMPDTILYDRIIQKIKTKKEALRKILEEEKISDPFTPKIIIGE